ncbi:hypothetical protein [Enorma massiliensis]|nr:hypothetical protein [Enorma massiliensis]
MDKTFLIIALVAALTRLADALRHLLKEWRNTFQSDGSGGRS